MKNMRLPFISLILMIILLSTAYSQQFEFKVMASKGSPVVQKDNSKSWDKIKVGSKVNSKDNIKLSGNSYLSLVHKSGKTIEIKSAGTYSVAELSKQVSSKSANVSGKFAQYLVDEISNSDALLAEGNYKANMETTGSVERDLSFMSKNNLKLNSPKKVFFINSVFTFKWLTLDNAKNYTFVLTDRFDKPVFKKDIQGTTITIDADELKLDRDTFYFWKVKADGNDKNKSDDACFMILPNDKIKAIKDTVDLIKKEVGDDNSASSKVILAAFYEQNYIFDEALKSYKEAVALAPGVVIYNNLYLRFLNRIKVTEK